MQIPISADPMGAAIHDFHNQNQTGVLEAESQISSWDEIPVSWLFRSYKQMPIVERKALDLCIGKVLDVGAAAGSHCLFLQNKGLDVCAMDISALSLEVAEQRGVRCIVNQDFFDFTDKTFDTLLFMMNGIGIAGTIDKLPLFFEKCKRLLNTGGQILLDSSDISYMFQSEDGSEWLDLNAVYYGELQYKMRYKNMESQPFEWLFVDYPLLEKQAKAAGLKCEKIVEGEHFDFLARLW